MSLALRPSIYDEISRARSLTDTLFAQVFPEALYDRPIRERHRLVFYLGHLDAFDWNIVGKGLLRQGAVSEELDSLFAFGIDPGSNQLPQDEASAWPNPSEVRRYVAQVRGKLNRLIHQASENTLRMILEHRLMHAETMTYLIHNLPYSRRLTRMRGVRFDGESPPMQFVRIPEGNVTMGMSSGTEFGWDNERAAHTEHVNAFGLAKYKVTNGQYLKFVEEGGPIPHYWIERHGAWRYRGYDGEIPLPNDFPVFVSYVQAEAYAKWIGKSLPSEAQFHRAAYGTASGSERQHPWGNESPRPDHGNFDFGYVDLVPVTVNPSGDSAFGISQLVGNGWEWTSSVFAPFPGFEADPLYPGYSADFFDGEHHVVKGASCATDHVLLRRSFRNWFRDHYRYAYTTFRLVEN